MRNSTNFLLAMTFTVLASSGRAAPANADANEALRAGVAVDALAPANMILREVQAPARVGLPVHLVYENAQHEISCVIGVLVAANAQLAGEALDRWRLAIVQQPAAIAGLGDRGYGASNVYGFVFANIMYSIRTVGSDLDAEPVARQALDAIRHAGSGSSQGARVTLQARNGTLRLGDGPLATRVISQGPVVVRATPDKNTWKILRTGAGAGVIRVIGVDARLRQSETSLRL